MTSTTELDVEYLLPFVEEAISSLGYIKPDRVEIISMLVCDAAKGLHPKQVATAYRKRLPQLANEQKRALGIRANTFMSVGAADDLTDKGRSSPIDAHHLTALRAWFSYLRARKLDAPPPYPNASLEYDGIFSQECPACLRLDRKVVAPGRASPFAPTDCARDACALSFRFRADFLGDLVDHHKAMETSHEQQPGERSWLTSLKRLLRRGR